VRYDGDVRRAGRSVFWRGRDTASQLTHQRNKYTCTNKPTHPACVLDQVEDGRVGQMLPAGEVVGRSACSSRAGVRSTRHAAVHAAHAPSCAPRPEGENPPPTCGPCWLQRRARMSSRDAQLDAPRRPLPLLEHLSLANHVAPVTGRGRTVAHSHTAGVHHLPTGAAAVKGARLLSAAAAGVRLSGPPLPGLRPSRTSPAPPRAVRARSLHVTVRVSPPPTGLPSLWSRRCTATRRSRELSSELSLIPDAPKPVPDPQQPPELP
jgi:hypothetical protein